MSHVSRSPRVIPRVCKCTNPLLKLQWRHEKNNQQLKAGVDSIFRSHTNGSTKSFTIANTEYTHKLFFRSYFPLTKNLAVMKLDFSQLPLISELYTKSYIVRNSANFTAKVYYENIFSRLPISVFTCSSNNDVSIAYLQTFAV